MTADELYTWTHAAKTALDTQFNLTIPEVDVQLLLDIARDAAHAVDRPAAPITTYLLGYAVGQGADPQAAATSLRHLAGEWDLGLHRE